MHGMYYSYITPEEQNVKTHISKSVEFDIEQTSHNQL